MTSVTERPCTVVVQMAGIQGRSGKADVLSATVTGSVFLTDLIPIVRGGELYLATLADVLAATAPSADEYTDAQGIPYTDANGDPYTAASSPPPSTTYTDASGNAYTDASGDPYTTL